jgi:hypothetical protein
VVISDDMPKENNRLRPHLRFFGSLLVQVDLASLCEVQVPYKAPTPNAIAGAESSAGSISVLSSL